MNYEFLDTLNRILEALDDIESELNTLDGEHVELMYMYSYRDRLREATLDAISDFKTLHHGLGIQ